MDLVSSWQPKLRQAKRTLYEEVNSVRNGNISQLSMHLSIATVVSAPASPTSCAECARSEGKVGDELFGRALTN